MNVINQKGFYLEFLMFFFCLKIIIIIKRQVYVDIYISTN